MTRRHFASWAAAAACAGLVVQPAAPVLAQECPQHAFWEINSRRLPECFSASVMDRLEFRECRSGYREIASMPSFLEDCRTGGYERVLLYVHGNWMPECDARARAQRVFQAVTSQSPSPICFVAYSWPSERKHGFARDVIGKKSRIDADSMYLANVLTQMPMELPLGALGYSFGAPVTCGALQLLGGGSLAGRALPAPATRPSSIRLSLMAPAFDQESFSLNGRYRKTLEIVEQVVNLYNSDDPILRRFRFFDRESAPVAAGFSGLRVSRLNDGRSTAQMEAHEIIRQYDCRVIGRTHDELDYYTCSGVRYAIQNILGF